MPSQAQSESSRGTFSGNPKVEWLPDGRSMQLLERFSFTDDAGREWEAPIQSKIDGASIPKLLWGRLGLGGPFEGLYRNASVVHDVECARPRVKPREAHRMFYEACRAAKQEERLSKKMYAALWFGTVVLGTCRPEMPTRIPVVHRVTRATVASGVTTQEYQLEKDQAALYQDQAWDELFTFIDTSNPSLEAIEEYELVLRSNVPE